MAYSQKKKKQGNHNMTIIGLIDLFPWEKTNRARMGPMMLSKPIDPIHMEIDLLAIPGLSAAIRFCLPRKSFLDIV